MERCTSVLVVDDDEEIRRQVVLALAALRCEVHEAMHGAEALRLLREGLQPDLVLLDLLMPVMDGWRFREEQLADPRLAEIPVVLLSSQAPSPRYPIDVAMMLGKPLQVTALRQTVARMLRAARPARTSTPGPVAAISTNPC